MAQTKRELIRDAVSFTLGLLNLYKISNNKIYELGEHDTNLIANNIYAYLEKTKREAEWTSSSRNEKL